MLHPFRRVGFVVARVPAGCHDVWVVDEWDALDPDVGHQIKYHAPGVGAEHIQAGDAQETLSLVSVSRLNDAAQAEVRGDALRLDRRADAHARDVYAGSTPAHKLP